MGDYSTIEIRGDNEDLKDSLSQAESMFKSFGDRVMALFSAATGVYSFDDAISKIKKGIADFEQSQEHVHKLERAMKMAGSAAGFTIQQMGEMNDQLRKLGKYSTDTITDAQSALSKFKNVRLDIFQEALARAMDLAEYMGGDFESAVKTLGAALNDPRKGLEDLEEAGVEFSRSQKNTIEAMLRMGDVVGAQRLILAELTDQMGGEGAKAANTFGRRMEDWARSTDKVWASIGGALVPWLNKLVDVTDKVQLVVQKLVEEWMAGFGGDGGIAISVEETAKVIGEYLMKAVDVGVQAFTVLQTAVETYQTTAKGVWLSIKATALSMFADLVDGAVSAGDKLVAMWPEITKAASDMWKKIVELAGWAWGEAQKYWDEFAAYTKTVLSGIWSNVESFIAKLKMMLTGQDPGEWLWKDFGAKFKHVGAEMPSLMDDIKKRGIGKAVGADDFVKGLRDDANRAAAGAAGAFQPFDAKFDDNLKANRKKVQDFADKVKGILDNDEYRDIIGTDTGKKFKLSKPDKDERPGSAATGGFEDLLSLNKRIQSAAMKTPSLQELEKQTKLMERELDIQQKMLGMMVKPARNGAGDAAANARRPGNDLAAVGMLDGLTGMGE